MTEKRKVRCPKCGRLMVQLAPKNREPGTGKSWHFQCLVDHVSQGLHARTK